MMMCVKCQVIFGSHRPTFLGLGGVPLRVRLRVSQGVDEIDILGQYARTRPHL